MAGPNRDQDLFVGGEALSKNVGVDGQGTYKIINPQRLYLGKSYSDWTTDWFNWFLSANADRRSAGPVVFLRSRGLPNATTGAYVSDVPNQGVGGVDGSSPTSSVIPEGCSYF